ncbi:unnamed protein product [Effrenium voratum]|nr:unnamed protein product [Effrenium voratum]
MGQLARGLALAVSLAAGAKDYMARVDPSLRTWTRSIRIAHDSFLDLELHRGQLRAFQGGQLFELPYAAARVDPDCPVNNENHLERTIVAVFRGLKRPPLGIVLTLGGLYGYMDGEGADVADDPAVELLLEMQSRSGRALWCRTARKRRLSQRSVKTTTRIWSGSRGHGYTVKICFGCQVWNHLPGCKSFASMGYCQRFAPLARKYCRLSCALCTVGGGASSVELVGEKDLQARARLRQSRWLALA